LFSPRFNQSFHIRDRTGNRGTGEFGAGGLEKNLTRESSLSSTEAPAARSTVSSDASLFPWI
jgi:hypothetical protein